MDAACLSSKTPRGATNVSVVSVRQLSVDVEWRWGGQRFVGLGCRPALRTMTRETPQPVGHRLAAQWGWRRLALEGSPAGFRSLGPREAIPTRRRTTKAASGRLGGLEGLSVICSKRDGVAMRISRQARERRRRRQAHTSSQETVWSITPVISLRSSLNPAPTGVSLGPGCSNAPPARGSSRRRRQHRATHPYCR